MPVINLVGEYHLGKNCYLHSGSKKGKMGKETIKDLADKMEQSQQELAERFSDIEDKISRSFRAVMDRLEGKLTSVESKIDSFEIKLDTVESHFKTAVGDLELRVTEVEKKVTDATQEVTEVKIDTLKELYDMDEKRSNMIVFGIPEPEGSGSVTLRDKDAKEIDSIFETIVGRKIAFEVKFRIGQKEENKTRPIVVKLRDLSDKEAVLSSSAALKDHQKWRNVYLKPDLTKFQRDFLKKQENELRAEALRRNSLLKNGEDWEWAIRGKGMMRHLTKVRKAQRSS